MVRFTVALRLTYFLHWEGAAWGADDDGGGDGWRAVMARREGTGGNGKERERESTFFFSPVINHLGVGIMKGFVVGYVTRVSLYYYFFF